MSISFVSTTEAAFLLNISTGRLRTLLNQDRIRGARKVKRHTKTRFREEGQGYLWEIFFEGGNPPRKSVKRGTRNNNNKKEHIKNRQQPQTYLENCNVVSYY